MATRFTLNSVSLDLEEVGSAIQIVLFLEFCMHFKYIYDECRIRFIVQERGDALEQRPRQLATETHTRRHTTAGTTR